LSGENGLDAWLAAEANVRAQLDAGPGPGLASPQDIFGKTGLEIMQEMLAGKLPYAWLARTLNFTLIEVSHGRVVIQGAPLPEHLNPMGTIHGGWIASILDTALGCSIQTTLPANHRYTTAELSVNYVKALTPSLLRVRAIGSVIHCGRQLATAEARLVDPNGILFAHAKTTCLILDPRT
jgi:uncharacterized protein (TIGR00369 family)